MVMLGMEREAAPEYLEIKTAELYIEKNPFIWPSTDSSQPLAEEEIVVFADKLRMGQVMENLLNNAVKYSGKNSTIKVVVTPLDKHCQVQVCDQGIGMTAEQSEQAFEKYYRADTSNTAPPGTGLGLFITKSIIDAHQGQIQISSTLGKSTTVTFQIPKP